MDHYQIIAENFKRTIETIVLSVDDLAAQIERGAELIVAALLADRKVIACGLGVDAALAQLLVCNLINRFEHDRPALPALLLGADSASVTAIARDSSIENVFARQLRALGYPGDVLVCFNSAEEASSLTRAVRAAQERNMAIMVLSSTMEKALPACTRPEDVMLSIQSTQRARIIEMHAMALHNICELIDYRLFGSHLPE